MYRAHRRMQATGAAKPNKARCTARLLVRALVLGPKKHFAICSGYVAEGLDEYRVLQTASWMRAGWPREKLSG